MPFRGFFSSNNIEASSSRKRSYAEISRSESRSSSPQNPSSKRRRTEPTATPSTNDLRVRNSSPRSFTPRPEPIPERYHGDGLDYRRPIMSTSSSVTQTWPVFIDLTGDDLPTQYQQDDQQEWQDDRDERSRSVSRDRAEEIRRRSIARADNLARLQQGANRGPRFGRDIIDEGIDLPPVIDLADSDATEEPEPENILEFDEDLFGDFVEEPSPEVTFLSERPAPGGPLEMTPSRIDHLRLPTPRRSNPFTNLRDMVSRNGNYRALSGSDIDEVREALGRETLDRIDGIAQPRMDQEGRERHIQRFGEFPIMPPLRHISVEDYPTINDMDIAMDLDYETAAFEVVDRDYLEIIEPPPLWPLRNGRRAGTAGDLEKEPYTKPKPLVKGFTMNFKEDACLECPSCHEELAMGEEGSTKAQVWMVKTCGHVYCGECATNRAISKRRGKAQKVVTNVTPFKMCLVKDCGKNVVARGAMFPVYL